MEKKDEERIRSLMEEIPELRALYQEHVQLKKTLETLNHKHHLTPEEEIERKRLQKLKLAGKDRMMALLAEHGQTPAKAMAAPRP